MIQPTASGPNEPRSRRPIAPDPLKFQYTSDPAQIVIPGLDTNASAFEQCDQLDQMITRKLQNIDANIAKANEVLATRLLPAFKKFALATEPVREAADFWLSFYEKAAAIRIPTEFEDTSEVEDYYEQDQASEATETAAHTHRSGSLSLSDANEASQNSFMPGAAVSSTPARGANASALSDGSGAWGASIDSPLVRLSQEIAALEDDEDTSMAPPPPPPPPPSIPQPSVAKQPYTTDGSFADESSATMDDDSLLGAPTPKQQKQHRFVRAQPSPLLRNVLSHSRGAQPTPRSSKRSRSRSPHRLPELKAQNPFTKPDKPWDGLVNVRGGGGGGGGGAGVGGPSSKTVFRAPAKAAPPSSQQQHAEEDEGDDWFPLARPRAEPAPIGRSPSKAAAQRSTADVLRALVERGKTAPSRAGVTAPALPSPRKYVQQESSGSGSALTPPAVSGRYARMWARERGGEESSMGSTLTPPSIARYAGAGGGEDDSPLPTPPDVGKYARYMDGYSSASAASSRRRSPSPSPVPSDRATERRYAEQERFERHQYREDTAELDLPPSARYAQPMQVDDDTIGSTADLPPSARYTHQRMDVSAASTMELDPSVTARWAPAGQQQQQQPAMRSYIQDDEDAPSAASLRTMMRDVGLEIPGFDDTGSHVGGEEDDSFGETMRPEQMALFARGHHGGGDDSFGSEGSSGSSFGEAIPAELQYAPVEEAFDDSFEDEEGVEGHHGQVEETVFGLLPARRQQGGLLLHGQAVLEDTATLGYGVMPVTSPTPTGR